MYPLLTAIIAADLTPATERVAIRLLALTAEHGYLSLSWPKYCQLSNRPNRSSARRHLSALVKAGLIRYHAAAQTYITILWPALVQPSDLVEPVHPAEHEPKNTEPAT